MIQALAVADRNPTGTRVLDAAKGILVGTRRCTLSEAFAEILAVAAEYEVGPLSLCRALIALAEGRPPLHTSAAEEAAHIEWGSLLALS
jgi:hypothetical protein